MSSNINASTNLTYGFLSSSLQTREDFLLSFIRFRASTNSRVMMYEIYFELLFFSGFSKCLFQMSVLFSF